ncbi:MAG: head-tail adaptor [Rickettsiales bacterium]|nr:head-tail adaptor [Rickettsiales bacterium]|tara:strand:- start:866 stop:1189 length:324 start_codon:yes stop_codon:yes gene_type:complete
MNPGALRERIRIEIETRSSDGMGGGGSSWNTLTTVWAKVEPLRGEERLQANQLQERITYRIIMRYRDDINARMRVLWGNKVLNIHSVFNADMHRRYLTLEASEGGSQ